MHSLPLPSFLVGLSLIYLGQRAFGGTSATVAVSLGLVALAVAYGSAIGRAMQSQDTRRKAYMRIFAEYVLAGAGILIFYIQSDGWELVAEGNLKTALSLLWPALIALGTLPAIYMEMAMKAMSKSPAIELWRVGFASHGARVVVLGLITFAGLNFAASVWNRQYDLSYFKTSKPGTSTQAIVEGVGQETVFYLFYPPGNQVLEQVRSYAEQLASASSLARVEVLDQALEPELSKKFRVTRNGTMVILSGVLHESLTVGLELEKARGQLKKLDIEVQKRLLRVARPARTAYFTTGHLERPIFADKEDTRRDFGDLKKVLERQGYTIKNLGLTEGLDNAVPDDASLVIIAGPREPFLEGERETLKKFLAAGGRVMAFFDPDQPEIDDKLLAVFGVQMSRGQIAADDPRLLVNLPGEGASPYSLVTNQIGAHPTNETFKKNRGRMGFVSVGGGALFTRTGSRFGHADVMKSMAISWVDINGNGKLDKPKEEKKSHTIAMALKRRQTRPPAPVKKADGKTKDGDDQAGSKTSDAKADPKEELPEVRALVFADPDVAGTGILPNPGNLYTILDGLKWLADEESEIGTIESEEDVRIVHRRDEDAKWFYGTSFVIPAFVLGGGLLYTRRTRRRSEGVDDEG